MGCPAHDPGAAAIVSDPPLPSTVKSRVVPSTDLRCQLVHRLVRLISKMIRRVVHVCSIVTSPVQCGAVSDVDAAEIATQVRDQHHNGSTKQTFGHYDADGDGHLTHPELKTLFGDHKTTRGFFAKSLKAGRLMKMLDDNGDGKIDQGEFEDEL